MGVLSSDDEYLSPHSDFASLNGTEDVLRLDKDSTSSSVLPRVVDECVSGVEDTPLTAMHGAENVPRGLVVRVTNLDSNLSCHVPLHALHAAAQTESLSLLHRDEQDDDEGCVVHEGISGGYRSGVLRRSITRLRTFSHLRTARMSVTRRSSTTPTNNTTFDNSINRSYSTQHHRSTRTTNTTGTTSATGATNTTGTTSAPGTTDTTGTTSAPGTTNTTGTTSAPGTTSVENARKDFIDLFNPVSVVHNDLLDKLVRSRDTCTAALRVDEVPLGGYECQRRPRSHTTENDPKDVQQHDDVQQHVQQHNDVQRHGDDMSS
eukprot:Lankesteria_metandrocarpae@DN3323_c1_g1_i2.p1